ncbi:hypothetical protein [Bradyrhizobium arachidis]|uniref:Uncharacterized protein n=1 Tax=Bradyrhizobium arachidis TaxID=858423 RepID=A0AAE7NJV5_9BRAD|nr:hypothetical protein [Bradyrhizobium arachidis]QOZ66642.1 hypothetical protein WN72_09900 [Bradyrhizobium arachidis]SFV19814.1 hypothetical protein SAMN05192541_1653 [Bradyrhizobium arachidis]
MANKYVGQIVRGQLRNMPARVTIVMRDGTRPQAETDLALGDPWKSDTAYGDDHVVENFELQAGSRKRGRMK